MNFHTRKWVKPEDLNPNGTLFGGSLLRWIDEEAAIYAIVQLGNQRVVTKYISEINFVSASRQGDIIELGITATEFGRTSITLTCEVRNKITRKSILTVVSLKSKGMVHSENVFEGLVGLQHFGTETSAVLCAVIDFLLPD